MGVATEWPIQQVSAAFERGSGAAKNATGKRALYGGDFYRVARVQVMWSDGGTEDIVFTYQDHGQCRDVFSGSSARAGSLVFKLHPAKFDSSQKEMAVRTSLRGNVIDCLWAGEVLGLRETYAGLLQRELRTVDRALADLCVSFEPGPAAFSRLTAVFYSVLTLYLDTVDAGFVLFDAGPRNLALEEDGRTAFLDWEHICRGEAKRKDINEQVRRVVAAAAAHMAQSPKWSGASTALKLFVVVLIRGGWS